MRNYILRKKRGKSHIFFDNKGNPIKDKKYINKITKGVYELGSIFKTFTVALAIDHELVDSDTIIENIPKKIKCSIHEITDMKEHPKNLTVVEILVRSLISSFRARTSAGTGDPPGVLVITLNSDFSPALGT